MSKGQNKILDTLLTNGPKSIQDLLYDTGLSISFIRLQLKYLESAGQVEKVDQRVPHIYRIPPENPIIKRQKLIEEYKTDLLGPDRTDRFVVWLNKFPKSEWIEMVPNLEALAVAITRLDEEGQLIDTLEDTA